ncbi:MAG: alpha-mannosyltransferase [Hyphomicrobiales bacterium]|nr:alpha-mannosyltransferase [Hyphomicrobiales bacterium]
MSWIDTHHPDAGQRRVLIVSDAWRPQINGVVRTLEWLRRDAPLLGIHVDLLTPDLFRSAPMPTYPEIRLTLALPSEVAKRIDALAPDAIHIATEGPLGLLARHYCTSRGRAFTTCYHTRFPEYLAARLPLPLSWSYAALRRFHSAAAATLVATPALRDELQARGFTRLKVWRRGVDVALFSAGKPALADLPRPIFLSVGRIAVEKNVEAFLALDLPGTKVVIGDGPARADLARRYPEVHFLGVRTGAELADLYASADVFVFPSRTDTFGLVMLEALAAGTPVAALPVTGPQEVLGASGCGVLSEDLRAAAMAALSISRSACRAYASHYGMRESAHSFFGHLGETLVTDQAA